MATLSTTKNGEHSRDSSFGNGSLNGVTIEHGDGKHHVNGFANEIAKSASVPEPSKAAKLTTSPPEPIAICGMACRLPCGIKTPSQLWDFLLAGYDARSEVPECRYNIEAFYDPSGKPGTTKTKYGYFLDDDLSALDISMFPASGKELEQMDPQQRLMLEVTRECLEDAGEVEWSGKRIGCYIGNLGEDWREMSKQDTQNFGVYRYLGYEDFSISNRVSYDMNFQGPSLTIRTACSSSMVAFHEACVAIGRGDCVSAIVGGTNLILRPDCTTVMSEQGVLSPDGSCKTFSASADGYARGEAIVGVFLKPLKDALRDGNAVRAVVRATATNHDGRTAGVTLPSADAQEALIRRAYQVAGLAVSDTAFVECHGTGTAVGDPLETEAISRVFCETGVTIGSTKPNLGHTEGASGIVSILKTVLMLENKMVPPSIKFSPKNPNINWECGKLVLAEEPLNWPENRMERVSVNSFGYGGSNAHAIIDSATLHKPKVQTPHEDDSQLFLFSANSTKSLTALADDYKAFIEESAPNLPAIAYTLARGREHLPYRSFSLAHRSSMGPAFSDSKSGKRKPKLAMIFTGQGAQWPRMGSDLLKSSPIFQSTIRSLDECLGHTMGDEASKWTIEQELLKFWNKSRVGVAEYSQPLCTAVQVALVDTLRTFDIEPDAVAGHSSGEIAAAYAAGALTAEEAIVIAYYRGIAVSTQNRSGAMAALGMAAEHVQKFLMPGVVIACENSPRSVTISGDTQKVEEVLCTIRAACPDILARKLQVDKAYHSHHMTEIGGSYRASIEQKLVAKSTKKPFFSSVESRLLCSSDALDSRYWQKNLEFPVMFRAAVTDLLRHYHDDDVILLEVGPHSALGGPLVQIMSDTPTAASYVPTMIRNENSTDNILSTIGRLFTLHFPLNLQALFPKGSCVSDLPRYPFDHSQTGRWNESRLSKAFRHRKCAHHDLLGIRILESTDLEPSWRNVLHLEHNIWLKDHKVGDDIVFPFAGYIAMVGEAVRQTTKIENAFRVRHVSVDTALLLTIARPTEVITTIRPLRLTITQDSTWFEFTISAYRNDQWIKHCSGEVKVESGMRSATNRHISFPRAVQSTSWFNAVRREGLDLGDKFQNLEDVTASTLRLEAQGTVSRRKFSADALSKHHLHPALLDSALQLSLIACANGLTRKHKNFLPVYCDEIYISRTSKAFVMDVQITKMGTGSTSSRIATGEGNLDGETVLKVAGLKMAAASIFEVETHDHHAAARLTWAPDLDFVNHQTILSSSSSRQRYCEALDRFGSMSIQRIHRQLVDIHTQVPQLQSYVQWLCTEALQPSLENEWTISPEMRQLRNELINSPAAAVVDIFDAIHDNTLPLSTGSALSWQSLVPPDTVTMFQKFITEIDNSEFFKLLSHSKPNFRVLELGDEIASPSAAVLQALTLPNGVASYAHYTFASKNPAANQERLSGYPNLQYVQVDINDDLASHTLDDGQFDVVIARNVFQSSHKSLRSIKRLLASDGYLYVQEISPSCKWIKAILGTSPEWWHETDDRKPDELHLYAESWREELEIAGFKAPENDTFVPRNAFQITTEFVVRPAFETATDGTKSIKLLVRDKSKVYNKIETELLKQGYDITKITLEDSPPSNSEIISIIDLDGAFFANITKDSFSRFQTFISRLKDSGIFWVTKSCHIRPQDPRYAQVLGLARVIRSELLIDFATCEIDDSESAYSLIGPVFEKFRTRIKDVRLLPDYEYVIDDGTVHIGRYYPFVMMDDFEHRETTSSERCKVVIGTPGRLDTLHWARQPPEPVPLKGDELELEMHAVGVNFKDVLIGMNLIEHASRYHGLEGAGIVRRVGHNVKDFKPGDRVAAMEHNMLSTLLITREDLCVEIPDTLSFMDAATMFTVYATVQHSLMTVGQLRKGQSLLIHSGCGGIGLAAIQIARLIGAEIYVTVGSEEKVQYLMKHFSIPRNRIFASRNSSFVEDIHRETGGKGVDQVLNSLSGELLHETWKCLAPFGKLVEIGKRELIGHGRLDMEPFAANRSYCCVDMDAFYDTDCLRLKEYMVETLEYLEKGLIQPIVIAKEFDAASVSDAFRYMLPGNHIGRIGIRIRDEDGRPTFKIDEAVSPRRKLELNPEFSYLLAGGLGGLGRAISVYMAEHGARNLIYLGRTAGESSADQDFIEDLKSMGVKVTVVRGSVTNLDDVSRAVAAAQNPLRGVLQLTTAQADESFSRLTKEQWDHTIGPKVDGTWNLHHATAGITLDFFVLASSMSATVGLPGQANYASGNSFLDAFVQYRNNMGLACSAINIGPVADIGLLSDSNALQHTAALTGFKTVQEQELLDAISLSMMRPKIPSEQAAPPPSFVDPNLFVLGLGSNTPLSSPSNRTIWRKDRRMAIYHNQTISKNTAATASSSNDQLKTYIANTRVDPNILTSPSCHKYFGQEIGKRLFNLLLKDENDLNMNLALTDLGLDSLVAIELRAWCKQAFGVDISVLEMMSMGNLESFGQHIAEMMLQVAKEREGEGTK